jgi:hypothetical protein
MSLVGAGAECGAVAACATRNARPSMFVLHSGEEQLGCLGAQLPEMRLEVDSFSVLEEWWNVDPWEQAAAAIAPDAFQACSGKSTPFPLYSQTEIYDGSAALHQLVNDAYRADDDGVLVGSRRGDDVPRDVSLMGAALMHGWWFGYPMSVEDLLAVSPIHRLFRKTLWSSRAGTLFSRGGKSLFDLKTNASVFTFDTKGSLALTRFLASRLSRRFPSASVCVPHDMYVLDVVPRSRLRFILDFRCSVAPQAGDSSSCDDEIGSLNEKGEERDSARLSPGAAGTRAVPPVTLSQTFDRLARVFPGILEQHPGPEAEGGGGFEGDPRPHACDSADRSRAEPRGREQSRGRPPAFTSGGPAGARQPDPGKSGRGRRQSSVP